MDKSRKHLQKEMDMHHRIYKMENKRNKRHAVIRNYKYKSQSSRKQ